MTIVPRHLVGALSVAFVVTLWPGEGALAQISPGPLSRPHADLDGNDGCLECHSPERGVDPARCLGCHVPLARRIEKGLGLHASDEYANCARCHVDHHGSEFELVWWGESGMETFDHALAGYLLGERHADASCRDCHRSANIETMAVAELRLRNKDLNRTFLGLGQRCDTCHVDEHRQQFAEMSCSQCHAGPEWKPALFEHDESRFPLQGSHRDLECASCHEPVHAGPAVDRRGRSMSPEFVPFRNDKLECSSCHADEHRGQFGARGCESCHSDSGWQPASGFDHATTRYALTGLHGQVPCAECHQITQGAALPSGDRAYHRYRPLASARCDDCHTDTHEGRIEGACSSCHTTAGWERRDADFDHALTRYVLEGKHAEVKCVACHEPGAGYRVENFARCEDCHIDAHYGQVALGAERGCDDCHSIAGFAPADYSPVDHTSAAYPLTGAHLEVACNQCHVARPVGQLAADGLLRVAHEVITRDAAVLTAQLRFAGFICESCHAGPHDTPRAVHGANPSARTTTTVSRTTSRVTSSTAAVPGAGRPCSSCHATTTWSVVDFDHAATGFLLEGKHLETRCSECHRPGGGAVALPGVARSLPFTGLVTTCDSCHDDAHRAQFAAADATRSACETCHGTADWRTHRFDHGTARFALEGAHATVGCLACHTPETDARGTFVRYRPLAMECEGCHTPLGAGGLP